MLVGPTGVIGSYRKVHLPYLGIDMFTSYGDRPFAVHNAVDLKVGMSICYDAAFPEASRSLAILGADLVALPTNWPPGAECTAASVINARAMENAVYFIAGQPRRYRTGIRVHRTQQDCRSIPSGAGRWPNRREYRKRSCTPRSTRPAIAR